MDEDVLGPDRADFVEARIVPDEVVTQDAFSGSGHSRTARSLAGTIKEFSRRDAAIGLEGSYGAGKSVVIAITQDILENDEDAEFDFRVFTYDLWSHQSESFRRGYLEELLAWSGPSAQKVLEQAVIEELQTDIRDRTVEITTENTQSFHWFAYVLLVAAPLLPLVLTWASPMAWSQNARNILFDVFGFLPFGLNSGILAQLLLLVLYLLFVCSIGHIYFRKPKNKDLEYKDEDVPSVSAKTKLKRALGEASQPFKTDKAQTERQTQIIREEDPSTLEFQKLFRRIIQAIQKQDQKPKPIKLVLVFDNIDRLQASRIPQVWGEMRSIFATALHREVASHGTVTAIVPFDQSLIDEAFGSTSKKGADNQDINAVIPGRELVSKTFAATLRVAPPIGFDSRDFFASKLAYATNGTLSTKQKWTIHRLFDLDALRRGASPSPRKIISFVNQIAVLWNERRGDIPPESLALYAIMSDRISENPSIIFAEKKIGTDFVALTAQPDWELHLAAMYYNVEVNHVLPIVMHREIEATFVKGAPEEVEQLSQRKHFDDALLAFALEYRSRFQPEDLHAYSSILRALSYVDLESPSVVESWRIFNRLDPYSGGEVAVGKDVLVALANRMIHVEAENVSAEIVSWIEFLFDQQASEVNLRDNIVPALDEVYDMLPAEKQEEWLGSIKEKSSTLDAEVAVSLALALNNASNLDVNIISAPTTGFDAGIINALIQKPSEVEPIVRANPDWLQLKLMKELCTQLFQNVDTQLGAEDAEDALLAIWACYEQEATILELSNTSRQSGNLVLLFKQAQEAENVPLAVRLFLLECLGAKAVNASQYPNKNVANLGHVQHAVLFYNEYVNDQTKVSTEFVHEVAQLISKATHGKPFRDLAIKAGAKSVYHAAFKEAVQLGNFSRPNWAGCIEIYENIQTILGESLFGKWLSMVAGQQEQPSFDYPISSQIRLLEDIERYEIASLYEYLDSQSDRFRELSEEDWLETLSGSNDLLPLLENRLLSERHPLNALASSTRFALIKHIGSAFEGEENWLEGDIYDRLFDALTASSQAELLTSVAADVVKERSDISQISEFAAAASSIFEQLPFHKFADGFVRNIVLPLLGSDLDFLVSFVSDNSDEVEKISGAVNSETTQLVRDDISAAHATPDTERRDQIEIVARAFNVEFDTQSDANPTE